MQGSWHAGNESGKSLQQSASMRSIHAKLSVAVSGTPESPLSPLSPISPRSPHMTLREKLAAVNAHPQIQAADHQRGIDIQFFCEKYQPWHLRLHHVLG